MADAVFVTVVLVFFALATLFVRACDAIVSSADDRGRSGGGAAEAAEVAS
ncbi:MAG: hypothetical protein MUF83_19815 [Acidimicrobiales bacterium]|jgi:hypothetical protein|nr:hypothetical protein [Acidimicrobiales bacterium]